MNKAIEESVNAIQVVEQHTEALSRIKEEIVENVADILQKFRDWWRNWGVQWDILNKRVERSERKT